MADSAASDGQMFVDEEGLESFEINCGNGWVLHDDTWDHLPWDDRLPTNIPIPGRGYQSGDECLFWRADNGLSNLQLSRDAPISVSAMDGATRLLWELQHTRLKDLCFRLPPNGPDYWGDDEEEANAAIDTIMLHNDRENNTTPQIYQRTFVVWPILVHDNYGYDWVTLFWLQRPATPDERNTTKCVGFVHELVIVDPRLDTKWYDDGNIDHNYTGRRKRIRNRLQTFLYRHYVHLPDMAAGTDAVDGFIKAQPMAENDTTSGERCFAVVKELFRRISEEVPSKYMWAPMERFVNPYAQRIEMTGLCAWLVMMMLGYQARINIEILPADKSNTVLLNGKPHNLDPRGLRGFDKEFPCGERFPFDQFMPTATAASPASNPDTSYVKAPEVQRESLRRPTGGNDPLLHDPVVNLHEPPLAYSDIFGVEMIDENLENLITQCDNSRQEEDDASEGEEIG